MRAYVRIRPGNVNPEALLQADLRRPPLRPLELGFTAAAAVPAYRHNAVIEAGMRRAEKLEGRLAALVEPILHQAGERAAAAFESAATDFLTAAAPAGSDVKRWSTMVCVKPRPDEAALLAPAGVDPDTLHVTLAYLGEVEGDLEPVLAELRAVAATHAPLAGVVGGYGLFTGQDLWPAILLPDVPGLVELRVAVTEALTRAGISYGRDHGFNAHVTLTYVEPGSAPLGEGGPFTEAQAGAPLHFDDLIVVRGDIDAHPLPLVGPPPVTAGGVTFERELASVLGGQILDADRPARAIPSAAQSALEAAPLIILAAGPPQWSPPAGDEILDVDAVVKQLRTKTDPVRLKLIETVMTPALAEAGLDYDVSNPLVAKLLAQSGSQVTNIAATTRLNVMRVIGKAHAEGLTIPDTAKAIRAGMRAASPARATLIARTELVGAVNGGSLAATQLVSQAAGITYRKEWLTAEGADFPRHEDYDGLNGQIVGLDALFDVGGTMLEFPGDPGGPPEEICNCRCTLIYHEGGDGTETANAGGSPPEPAGPPAPPPMPLVDAIDHYHSPLAFALNDALRTGKALTPQQEAVTSALDAGFAPAPKGGVVVYRGIPDTKEVFGKTKPAVKQHLDEPGYMSTTATPQVAHDFASGISYGEQRPAIMRIVVPEGTPVLRIPAGPYGDQDEWLLPRGMGLRVESVEGRMATADQIDAGANTPLVNMSVLSRPTIETLQPTTEAALARSADPYVASLQAELESLKNKIANVQWYIKNGKEQPHHAGRLKALELRAGKVRGLLEEKPLLRDELEAVDQQLVILRAVLKGDPGNAQIKESLKLYEQRKKVLEELAAPTGDDALVPGPAPVTPPVGPLPGNLIADLEAIEGRAEWITPNEAARMSAEKTMSGYDPYYYPTPAQVAENGPVAGYLQDQVKAVFEAGARVEQEMAIPASLDADIDRAAAYVTRVKEELEQTLAPLRAAYQQAQDALEEITSAARDRVAIAKFGKKFDELEFGERSQVFTEIGSDQEWARRRDIVREAAARKDAAQSVGFKQMDASRQAEKSARSVKALAVRDAALRVLSEVRPMGPKPGKEIQLVGNARGYKKAGALLEKGQGYYPTTWIGAMRPIEPGTAARGYHQNWGSQAKIKVSTSDRSAVGGDAPGLPTAIHELGHEVEETNAIVFALERAFYEYRTRGGTWAGEQESITKMSKLKPGHGYGSHEVAREDKFSEPYMGKEYGGRNYELLTMGMEALFTGSEVLDAEYLRWLLGVLALA